MSQILYTRFTVIMNFHSPEYASDCTSSDCRLKLPPEFGGHPFLFCCAARIVCVASKDGPRGGTSGGAGSGGESLPLSDKRQQMKLNHLKCSQAR